MSTLTATPPLADRFRRQGAMIMTVFALPWAATGIGILGAGVGYWSALGAAVLITAGLAVYSVRFDAGKVAGRTVPANWRRRYNLAVLAELALIAVAVFTLIRLDAAPLAPAVVALIVGVHFFPLAKVFAQPQYLVTGAGLTLAAVVGAVLFAVADPALCAVAAGLGSAVTLWWTSLRVTRAG